MQVGWEREERSSSFFYQNMASRASEKMDKSPCSIPLPGIPLESAMFYIGYCLLYSRTRRDVYSSSARPRVRPRGRATQRAHGEIFKL